MQASLIALPWAVMNTNASRIRSNNRTQSPLVKQLFAFDLFNIALSATNLSDTTPALPRAQNLFLNRISKLKLFVRALSLLVEACSYCAINERRSETRYSSARIWLGSEVTLVE